MKILDVDFQRYLSGPVLGLIMISWPQFASARIDYFELEPEQLLSAQVVTASKHLESVAEAPAAIYVVTSEDILRSGVTTLADVLRIVPGVQVAQSDSNSWSVSIRGFNGKLSNKLLVLIDGRALYNPVFGGMFWESQEVPLTDIARIEVVRGPGGTLWGANAVNGVINIITKNTKDTNGNLASGIYGNEESGMLSLRHGGQISEKTHYRVYTKMFKRDASVSPLGGEAYDEWNGLRSGFRLDEGESFTLQGDIYRNHAQQRRADFSFTEPYSAIRNQTLVYSGANLLARWSHKNTDGSQFDLQSYIDWTQRDEPYNFLDKRTIYDVEAQYNFAAMGIQEWVTGAGFRFSSDNEVGNKNSFFSPPSRRSSVYHVFAQDKITLLKNAWYLTLGSKFEHNEFSGTEIQPNARLQWHINQDHSAWSAVSRAVRTPTPIEVDLTSTIAGNQNSRVALVPNDNFQPEQLIAYEIGYRNQISDAISADFTTFYNDYSDLQTSVYKPFIAVNNGEDPPHFVVPVMFTNDMTGKAYGFEAVMAWSVNPDIKVTASYSYFELAATALLPEQESIEGGAPTHQIGLRILWNVQADWTFDTSTFYVDSLPLDSVDHYVRMDANLGGRLAEGLRMNIVAQNILASSHREFGAATDINAGEIERSIFGKLTWEF